MKIIDRKTFLNMPENTVFSKYEPDIFMNLQIKGKSLGNDFFYQPIADSLDVNSFEERCEYLDNKKEILVNFYIESRDGCFENDQLFAVWSKEDIVKLIDRLKKCV